jgi:hypothetical protein
VNDQDQASSTKLSGENKHSGEVVMRYLFLLLVLMSFPLIAGQQVSLEKCQENKAYRLGQTSASMLIKYAEHRKICANASEQEAAEQRYLLLFDVYIKAHSYAILNKVFFWLSVISAIMVLLWPSLSIVFKNRLDKWQWLKSATVQTTVTAIAALMFTFYSQYKDKQTYAETLMRHVIHSQQEPHQLALQVTEELARIDRGFSFNSIINEGN